jgi:hypothetical protein
MNIPDHELSVEFHDAWLMHRVHDDFYDPYAWFTYRDDDRSMYICGGEL